ncbi:MAG: hypothetical protein A3E25_11720 [Burkholderiales bacterium RIFCSPHIGHO2_12_FULL_69_20]|nr:MAG: hypothetical protein A3E25_11720 [Burkholderiales bacterium RIFCSPHIGHO2_12_FULL_69_20]
MHRALAGRLPRWLAALAAAMLTLAGPAALAAQHALLIGVDRVAALPQRLWLQGTANDVTAMRQALLARGVAPAHITVLADHAPAASGRATRAAVDAALTALLARVRPGDGVWLHFAGHGVQVPQAPGAARAEPDGLDEVFLTVDAQPWDAASARLPRALYDDEIDRWIDALVDRGATVSAVFDTCHAAGLSRSAAPVLHPRRVAADELGVPQALAARPAVVSASASASSSTTPRSDGRVLMFAARAHELTGEQRLPWAGGGGTARVQGIFTHAVSQALAAGARDAAAMRSALRLQYQRAGRQSPVPQVLGADTEALP